MKKGIFDVFRRKEEKKEKKETAVKAKPAALSPEEAAAEKERKKQEVIAAYKKKRTLTVEKLFQIAELELPESFEAIRDTVIDQFTTDPRRLTEKSVFMNWERPMSAWMPTEVLDAAIERKCLCIITDTPCEYPFVACFPHDGQGENPVRDAYVKIGKYIRKIHKAKVITVTGSVGKTSTKEMVESVLRAHYRQPLVSRGNNNSLFSVTRNIQNLRRFHNVYLQEVGAAVPQTVEMSARLLEADITLFTNIGQSHLEKYGTVEALAADKLSLSDLGNPAGTAIINYDDPILMAHDYKQKKVTYSLNTEDADYYAEDIRQEGAGFRFFIVSRGEDGEKIRRAARVNTLGEHNVLNAVAAFAVGKTLKLSDEEIIRGIDAYRPSGLRQNLIEAGPYHIFADCYNSSLLAMQNTLSAMDMMDLPEEGGRKIAVLGDVLELGAASEETHRNIGREVAAHDVDLLLGFGKDIALACEEAGKAGTDARFFSDRKQLEEEIRKEITPKDLILFKGSHGINLGATMDRLFGTDENESTQIGHKMFNLEMIGDFEFYIFDTAASVKRYLGEKEEVQVPAFVKAVPFTLEEESEKEPEPVQLSVEKIGKTAFRGMEHVKKVILPDTIVRIRDGAFKGSGLTEFTAPESLLSIGEEALADCPNLEKVLLPEKIYQVGEKLVENSPLAVVEYQA